MRARVMTSQSPMPNAMTRLIVTTMVRTGTGREPSSMLEWY